MKKNDMIQKRLSTGLKYALIWGVLCFVFDASSQYLFTNLRHFTTPAWKDVCLWAGFQAFQAFLIGFVSTEWNKLVRIVFFLSVIVFLSPYLHTSAFIIIREHTYLELSGRYYYLEWFFWLMFIFTFPIWTIIFSRSNNLLNILLRNRSNQGSQM